MGYEATSFCCQSRSRPSFKPTSAALINDMRMGQHWPGRYNTRNGTHEDTAMCGRFTLHSSGEVVAEAFDLPDVPVLQPRYRTEFALPTYRLDVTNQVSFDQKN